MEYSTTHDSVNGRTPHTHDPPAVVASTPATAIAPPVASTPAQGNAGGDRAHYVADHSASNSSLLEHEDGYKPLIITNQQTGQKAVYPPLCRNNDEWQKEPVVIEDPILGHLERPLLVPTDLDRRVDCASVWIKLVPHTNEVVYFMPGACSECLRLQQHCDRSAPTCGRCRKRGATCVLGPLKHLRPAPPLPVEPVRRYTAAEKGKGRADSDESVDEHGNPLEDGTEVVEEGGRGKRVKKKRRLSASDEVDPSLLNFDGTALRKARARPSRSATQLPPPTAGPLRPEDVASTEEDMKWDRLCEINAQRPSLRDLVGLPPFWSNRRRALQAASPFFRNPIRTTGASVDIGPGGTARGVILEGIAAPTVGKDYFGKGKRAGSIRATIGQARRKQQPSDVKRSETPVLTIADDFQRVFQAGAPGISEVHGANGNAPATEDTPAAALEEPVVEALLQAQRAGTPIALALSPTYAGAPFRVPKAILGLGWFWILDAWTERVGLRQDPTAYAYDVAWKFRFEWCEGDQGQPWWQSKDADMRITPGAIHKGLDGSKPPVTVRGPGVSGPTTWRGQSGEASTGNSVHCRTCDGWSTRVYEDWSPCLNEECVDFSTDRSVDTDGVPPPPEVAATPSLDSDAHSNLLLPGPTGFAPPSVVECAASDVKRHDAQRDMWRAWVCSRCHMANERQDWFGVLCQWCARLDFPTRTVYTAAALRNPSRPVYVGGRQEGGLDMWAFQPGQVSTYFADKIKVIWHQCYEGLGRGTEIKHALHSEATEPDIVGAILTGLQVQGKDEVRLHRYMLPATSSRASELSLSPFYTFLAGPTPFPYIAHFPTGEAVKWEYAPQVVRDAAHFLNERCGRLTSPKPAPEFNSLLIAAMPPVSPATIHPIIPVEVETTMALLVLGADMTFRFKRPGKRQCAGELVAQHGDVLLVEAGVDDIEIEVRPDGFGFVCIGRHAYATDGGLAKLPGLPAEPPSGPLTNWYIGASPLDVGSPLRPQPPIRTDPPTEGDDDVDAEAFLAPPLFRGIEVIKPGSPSQLLRAPKLPPMPPVETEKPKRGRASMAGDDDSDAEAASAPGRGRGRGRGRGGAAGRGRGARVASGTGRGRGRGGATRGRARGRGRGRGRASGSGTRSASAADPEGEGSELVDAADADNTMDMEVDDVGNGDVEPEADVGAREATGAEASVPATFDAA